MHLYGTKTEGEREDQEAARLVRSQPKLKPPRRDKRRERMNDAGDPDIDSDRDLKKDPDLSMNYKTIGGSSTLIKCKGPVYSSYSNKLLITARHNEPPKEETMTIKFAKADADRILTRLDKMADTIQTHHEKFGMSFAVAKSLVNDLDQTADEIEKAAFGEESFQTRQAEVYKAAGVIQSDADEEYMSTFNAPSAPHQTDADEGYMSQFEDDQTLAVVSGKSTTGRPLAP